MTPPPASLLNIPRLLSPFKVIADSLASQMFAEDDDEGPGLAVDREHFPLLRDRAALAAVGDSMLSALSSDRFSAEVGGRDPPVSLSFFFLFFLARFWFVFVFLPCPRTKKHQHARSMFARLFFFLVFFFRGKGG